MIALAFYSQEILMQGKQTEQLKRKLVLHKETVRILTDKELAGVAGGAGSGHCSGDTCRCNGTCGNNLTTCPK